MCVGGVGVCGWVCVSICNNRVKLRRRNNDINKNSQI